MTSGSVVFQELSTPFRNSKNGCFNQRSYYLL